MPVGRGIDGLLRGGGPELRCQHVPGHQLIADLGVEICAQQRLLRDGLLFGPPQLIGVGGAEGQAEFLEAGAQHVFRIVQHGQAAFQPGSHRSAQRAGAGRSERL